MATKIIRTGKGHKLKHNVPRNLLKVVGQTAWVKWLGKNYSAAEADQHRASFDVECTALVRQLNRLPPDDRQKLIEAGGLTGVDGRAHFKRLAIQDLESFNDADSIKLFEHFGVVPSRDKIDALHGKFAVGALKAKRDLSDLEKAIAARDKAFVAQRADGLYTLADLAEALEPTLSSKGKKRSRLYIKRLIDHLGGDRKPSSVQQKDIVGWRDAMAEAGVTMVNQQQHLNKMSGLFGRALSEGKVDAKGRTWRR